MMFYIHFVGYFSLFYFLYCFYEFCWISYGISVFSYVFLACSNFSLSVRFSRFMAYSLLIASSFVGNSST